MKCSICEKEFEYSSRTWQDQKTKQWFCEHDSPSIGVVDKLENARKENRLRTSEALRMAGQAQAVDRELNPDVVLAPIDRPGQQTPFGNTPLTVKKSVLDSIAKKGVKYSEENN